MPSKPRPKESASEPVAPRMAEHGDWRAGRLAQIRHVIHEADPEAVEERKWKKPTNPAGVPVWSHDGIICTGETYKDHVRVTFAKGALLKDPKGLFNASLKGNAFRAIVIREGDAVREGALKDLICEAVAFNMSAAAERRK